MVEKLGYVRKGPSYEHPQGRKLVFVGDLLNRGPDSAGVLKIVRKTWEEGNAYVALGNHEFRILQLASMNKGLPDASYEPFVPWFKKLPLFLDLQDIRVVHAAWHISSIALISQAPVPDNSFIQATLDKNSPERKAVDRILKGVMANLAGRLDSSRSIRNRPTKRTASMVGRLKGKTLWGSALVPDVRQFARRDS